MSPSLLFLDEDLGSQNFQTISASYKTRKPTFLVEQENSFYV
jgi:hypothetical protein